MLRAHKEYMKPKWHHGKVNLSGDYKVRVTNAAGQEFAPGANCDGYNLGTISGAMKSGVGILLAQGESGVVAVVSPKNKTMVRITVDIRGKDCL